MLKKRCQLGEREDEDEVEEQLEVRNATLDRLGHFARC